MSDLDLDLDAIQAKWLRVCGPCDAGYPTTCSHPDEDYRPVIAELVAEVERLKALVGDENQPGWDNCSRAEAIRQATESHAGLLRWSEMHDARRDQRDTALAEVERLKANQLPDDTIAVLASDLGMDDPHRGHDSDDVDGFPHPRICLTCSTEDLDVEYFRRPQATIEDIRATIRDVLANQLPDGGEWRTEYAHRDGTGQQIEPWKFHVPWRSDEGRAYCVQNGCQERRVWTGPAEPLSDVLATPDPDSAESATASRDPGMP